MLTGKLVRVREVNDRIIPLYLDANHPRWLEAAESLLLIFREGVGRTRGEIEEEVEALVGEGLATLAHRGLAKVLEDRAEFEVVADLPPEQVRQSVFEAAAKLRQDLLKGGRRVPFRRETALERAGVELEMPPEKIEAALFADLKDENRMLSFKDISAKKLVERYNVALAQAVLLPRSRSTSSSSSKHCSLSPDLSLAQVSSAFVQRRWDERTGIRLSHRWSAEPI